MMTLNSHLKIILLTSSTFLTHLLSSRVVDATEVCSYFMNNGTQQNTTCSGICCSGTASSADQACCSSGWSSSLYIGLCVPIVCFILSALGGVSYCCIIFKSNARRNQVSSADSLNASDDDDDDDDDDDPPSCDPNKDAPPNYNDLFNTLQPKKKWSIVSISFIKSSCKSSNAASNLNENAVRSTNNAANQTTNATTTTLPPKAKRSTTATTTTTTTTTMISGDEFSRNESVQSMPPPYRFSEDNYYYVV